MKAGKRPLSKIALTLLSCFSVFILQAQFVKVASNTTVSFIDLSVIKKSNIYDILIGGDQYYLVGSIDTCNSLLPLSAGPMGNQQRICRLDSLNTFKLQYSAVQCQFSKSANGGQSFAFRSIYFRSNLELLMVDSTLGYYINVGSTLFKTTDGGISFNNVPMPIGINYIYVQKLFTPTPTDTILVFAGNSGTVNSLVMSTDRGNTWSASTFGSYDLNSNDGYLSGAACIGVDSFAAINNKGEVFFTKNKGQNWQKRKSSLYKGAGIFGTKPGYFYALGSNANNKAMVSVSNDFGETWQSFETPFTGSLLNMAMIGDSVALLTGTNGLILKWYLRDVLRTGIRTQKNSVNNFYIVPNPVTSTLKITRRSEKITSYRISSVIGTVIKNGFMEEEAIDVFDLPLGLYLIELSDSSETYKVLKFIKE